MKVALSTIGGTFSRPWPVLGGTQKKGRQSREEDSPAVLAPLLPSLVWESRWREETLFSDSGRQPAALGVPPSLASHSRGDAWAFPGGLGWRRLLAAACPEQAS